MDFDMAEKQNEEIAKKYVKGRAVSLHVPLGFFRDRI
jgi:hypothetical protein